MQIYGWEPVRCFESFPLGWGRVADLSLSSNQMVSMNWQNCEMNENEERYGWLSEKKNCQMNVKMDRTMDGWLVEVMNMVKETHEWVSMGDLMISRNDWLHERKDDWMTEWSTQ